MLLEDQTSSQPSTMPKDYYWAVEPDPKQMAAYLVDKRKKFYEFLNMSNFYSRIRRNWDFYHNLYPGSAGFNSEIGTGGEEEQFSLVAVNHFRSLLHMLITYVTANRPDWDAKAVNGSVKALEQAKFANQLLDYYMEAKGLEEYFFRAIEHSLVLTAGFIYTRWDEAEGDLFDANPETGQMFTRGDIKFSNPSVFEVIYDHGLRSWSDSRWHLIHSLRNKWELAEQFYDHRDEIIKITRTKLRDEYHYARSGLTNDSEDLIDFWEFYHAKSAASPEGRYFSMAGDNVPLLDGANPYTCSVLHRLTPAEFLLTSFGYSPGFDLQGLQEFLNMEWSTILTNHNNLGPTKLWSKAGEPINLADLLPGINVLQTDTPPVPLSFAHTPDEIMKTPGTIVKEMEYISGINAVSRGQPEASYRSGTALAQIDAKTNQYNSPFVSRFHKFLGDVGTSVFKILKQFARDPRTVALAGPQGQVALREFTSEDLELVDHVIIQAGNSYLRTQTGRVEVGNMLLQNRLVNAPEEYLNILNTGQLRPLTETTEAQLTLVHEENEALKQGQQLTARMLDNQILHLKKHSAVIDSIDARIASPVIVVAVETHCIQHLQLLSNPICQAYQIAMGYATPEQVQLIGMLGMVGVQTMQAAKQQTGGGQPPAGPPGGYSPPAPARNVPPAATDQTRVAMAENANPEGGR